MTNEDTRPTPFGEDEWHEHARFLRRLTRALCVDEAEADDLAQAAAVRALEGAPVDVRSPRAWLRRVVRNLRAERARGEARRRERERAVRCVAAERSAAEAAAALEVQRQVAAEAAALPEPYRTAVYLRHYRDLSPADVARELGVPVETVRTRLKRAHAMLRERLDDHHGRREHWRQALLPLIGASGVVPRVEHASPWSGAGLTGAGAMASANTKTVLAVVAVAIVVAAFAVRYSGPEGLAPPEPGRAPVRAAPASVVESDRPDPAPARAPIPAPERAASDRPERTSLRGAIVAVDTRGQDVPGLSGSFRIQGIEGPDVEWIDVAVEHGAFRTAVPASVRLLVREIHLGGRRASLGIADKYVSVPTSGAITLRAFWWNAVVLRVRDERGVEIVRGIEVRARDEYRDRDLDLHPGDDPRHRGIAADAASPIELPPLPHTYPYWVRAPGTSWSRIDVDHSVGGEREVTLVPGGAVEVEVEGDLPDGSCLRLRRSGGTPRGWYAQVRDVERDGATRVGGLRPGTYTVLAVTGEGRGAATIGSVDAVVAVGATAAAKIIVDTSALPDLVRLTGSVTLPDGFEPSFQIGIQPADSRGGRRPSPAGEQAPIWIHSRDMSPDPEVRRRWTWDAGAVRPGRYLAHVSAGQWREVFEVTDPGPCSWDLELPAAAQVVVDVVDGETGRLVTPTKVQHSARQVVGITSDSLADARLDSDTGRATFTAVAGRYRVTAQHPDFRDSEASVDLVAGHNHVTVRMEVAYGVRLRVRSTGAAVPLGWREWRTSRAERDGLAAATLGSSTGAGGHTIYLDGPGAVVVHAPVLSGYEPAEPRAVTIERGVVDVIFDLEPVR